MKQSFIVGFAALIVLSVSGCGKDYSMKPIHAEKFRTTWIKVGDRDTILIAWVNDPGLKRSREAAAINNGSNGLISIFNVDTKGDCEPTGAIVVDPMRVCEDLEKLKLRAMTKDGWVDLPVPARVKGMSKHWDSR